MSSPYSLMLPKQYCGDKILFLMLLIVIGRGKWGVVWGWGGDGLLVGQLDSASIGPKWSQS